MLRILAIMGLLVAGCFWVSIAGAKEPAPNGLRMVRMIEVENSENDKWREARMILETDFGELREERNQAKWIAIGSLVVLSVANLVIAKRMPKGRAEGEGKK
jgi:hypothetical protein